jgi:hypothetical protein
VLIDLVEPPEDKEGVGGIEPKFDKAGAFNVREEAWLLNTIELFVFLSCGIDISEYYPKARTGRTGHARVNKFVCAW